MYLFWHTVKVPLVEAWLLYKRDCGFLGIPSKTNLNHRRFQAQVATSWILVNHGKRWTSAQPSSSATTPESSTPKVARQGLRRPTVNGQKDQVAHWPKEEVAVEYARITKLTQHVKNVGCTYALRKDVIAINNSLSSYFYETLYFLRI